MKGLRKLKSRIRLWYLKRKINRIFNRAFKGMAEEIKESIIKAFAEAEKQGKKNENSII